MGPLNYEPVEFEPISTVWTNGVFDLLHEGHLATLRFAAELAYELGGVLVVGLNTDEATKLLKGTERPIQSYEVRKAAIEALPFVALVVPIGTDPTEQIRELKPSVIVKGGDYREDEVKGREYAGRVVIAPTLPGFSTTAIINQRSLT